MVIVNINILTKPSIFVYMSFVINKNENFSVCHDIALYYCYTLKIIYT